ncbi:MAG: MFS transporter [Candidatus Omnitrophica bacterium]|nr:MFS transporter [Candidatus Omnitrophota bacterium]
MSIPKSWIPQLAWASYDFANTLFSMNIISLYFALWVTREQGGKDLYYSLVHAASVLVVMMLAPGLGCRADERGKTKSFLIAATLICIAATALIGILNKLGWGLFFFFLANIGFQLGLVFYDSLLPSVAAEKDYGTVSGFGVALGYLGAIAGIFLVTPFVEVHGQIFRSRAFVPTAFYFLLFSLPCFILVQDRKSKLETAKRSSGLNLLELRTKQPAVFFYLASMFLLQNAANTVILFMSVYATEVGHFSQHALSIFLSVSTVTAVFASFGFGQLVDRIGALKVFQITIGVWIAGLIGALFGNNPPVLWVAGSLMGVGLGGLWTASRPLLLSLIPKNETGAYFGLNAFAGRFSALIGPLLWGLVVWILEPWGIFRYYAAISVLILFACASGVVSREIKVVK